MKNEEPSSTSGQVNPLEFNTKKDFSDYMEMPSRGYCQLFRAQRYGKWYVLKGLKPQYQANPLYVTMMEKEFDAAIRMNHPHIIHTIGIEKDAVAGLCIVMEYADGRTLSDFLKEHPSAELRKKVMFQLLDAMRYYHALQIVHRDLKPSNILVTRNGNNVKLIDFGLADADDYTLLKEPAYTKGYAAPEQMIPGTPVDCRTDIYAFGVILRQLFPHRYRRIARRCTQPDPDNRYRDVEQLLTAFRHSRLKNATWLLMFFAVLLIIFFVIYKKGFFTDSSESAPNHAPIVIAQQDTPEPASSGNSAVSHADMFQKQIITTNQAVALLQDYADSLFDDYQNRLANRAFPTQLAALYHAEINQMFTNRYKYFLLAHFRDGRKNPISLFRILHSPLYNDTKRYRQITDSLSLPQCDSPNNPFECQAEEKALEEKLHSLSNEIVQLNQWYLEKEYDSMLFHTKKWFPSVR